MERELSKTPSVPILTNESVALLNQLLFEKGPPAKAADVLFIFGTTSCFDEAILHLQPLILAKIAPKIVFTGGISQYSDLPRMHATEAERMRNALTIPKDIEVLLETKSQNTLENAQFGTKNLQARSILFVTSNLYVTRCYLSLKKFVNAKLSSSSFVAHGLYPEAWQNSPENRSRVWGEYLRLKMYSERGDFEVSEFEHLIASIHPS